MLYIWFVLPYIRPIFKDIFGFIFYKKIRENSKKLSKNPKPL